MNRKGISQIISSVLILAVAVSIASLYADWAPGFAGNIAGEYVSDSQQDIKCQNAGLSLRNPEYDTSDRDLTVDIENSGTIRLPTEITVGALNSSLLIAKKEVSGLGVEETRTVAMNIDKKPGSVIATSEDCNELDAETNYIDVTE